MALKLDYSAIEATPLGLVLHLDPTCSTVLLTRTELSSIPQTYSSVLPNSIYVTPSANRLIWNAFSHFRKSHNLPYRGFIINGHSASPASPHSVEFLDELFLDTVLASKPPESWLEVAESMVLADAVDHRGWRRIAEAAAKLEACKLAASAFYEAFKRVKEEKWRYWYERRIAQVCGKTEAGGAWTQEEVDSLKVLRNESIKEVLVKDSAWSMELGVDLEPVQLRKGLIVPDIAGKGLPRFFSWVIPLKLAGVSTPRNEGDIQLLEKLGITLVITLTEEEPLRQDWFRGNIRNLFVPVSNCRPPTVLQMDRIIQEIYLESFAGRTVVHCGGGKGRAGTVLATYIALFGLSPRVQAEGDPPAFSASEAVQKLRDLRPGSIETRIQEDFVQRYSTLAWRRYGQGEALYGNGGAPEEPAGQQLDVTGDIGSPDAIFLCGLQGSGKSTFSMLARLRNTNVIVVSPDDVVAQSDGKLGSASATKAIEGVLGRFKATPGQNIGKRILVLDRCNPTAVERKMLLKLVVGDAKIIAVWFDFAPEVCQARVERRGAHPTLPPHRAGRAISSTAKQMQPPALQEGFYGIATVRCIENAVELAERLFGPIPFQKFPRIAHLLDLGAATSDDLILPPAELHTHLTFSGHVIIEEKVDGSQMGFSLSSTGELLIQNKSRYITSRDHSQYSRLPHWLERKEDAVRKVLGNGKELQRWVLFGEWVAATHSLQYTQLEDWFIAFSVYDRIEKRFVRRREAEARLAGTGLCMPPVLYEGILGDEKLLVRLLETKSKYEPNIQVEGLVVKWQDGKWGKVVRADFTPGNAGWKRGDVMFNELAENRK